MQNTKKGFIDIFILISALLAVSMGLIVIKLQFIVPISLSIILFDVWVFGGAIVYALIPESFLEKTLISEKKLKLIIQWTAIFLESIIIFQHREIVETLLINLMR